jgi:hypothetical protein
LFKSRGRESFDCWKHCAGKNQSDKTGELVLEITS